jgi:hypothetical protein
MMTLIAIATAYLYSSAVVFGLTGKMFFWELASLVDIMLLGHWIDMKSVMGASTKTLEELAKLETKEQPAPSCLHGRVVPTCEQCVVNLIRADLQGWNTECKLSKELEMSGIKTTLETPTKKPI